MPLSEADKVGGLDIAMNQPALMHQAERRGKGNRVRQEIGQRADGHIECV